MRENQPKTIPCLAKKSNGECKMKKATMYLQSEHGGLQQILLKVEQLQALNTKILAYIDPQLVPLCQVANIHEQRLVMVVANGSVATQLRFQTPDLLKQFKQDAALSFIREIHYKVDVPLAIAAAGAEVAATGTGTAIGDATTRKPVALLSPETADLVAAIAETLTDTKLREIMEKIASHVKKNS